MSTVRYPILSPRYPRAGVRTYTILVQDKIVQYSRLEHRYEDGAEAVDEAGVSESETECAELEDEVGVGHPHR